MRGTVANTATLITACVLSVGGVACDGNDELNDLERGRDTRPAIDASPPDEAN